MRKLLIFLLLIPLMIFSQPVEPPEGAKCPICGMDVNMYPKFTAQLKLKDGSYVFTESPKHALQYYMKNKDKVAEIWVKDFSTGKWIDGRRAYYVVIEEGPMGRDLAPFRSLAKAKKFAKGREVIRFRKITMEMLMHLDMGMHMEHKKEGHGMHMHMKH